MFHFIGMVRLGGSDGTSHAGLSGIYPSFLLFADYSKMLMPRCLKWMHLLHIGKFAINNQKLGGNFSCRAYVQEITRLYAHVQIRYDRIVGRPGPLTFVPPTLYPRNVLRRKLCSGEFIFRLFIRRRRYQWRRRQFEAQEVLHRNKWFVMS